MLSRFLSSRRASARAAAAVPPGQRVYAIGDIHGRLDLLDALLAQIAQDDATRGAAATSHVFLGDLVDRGPDSAGVIERVRRLAAHGGQVHLLLGNHEEVFLLALAGDEPATRLFCRIGGRETVLSYGVELDEYEQLSYAEVSDRLCALVPAAHRDFLERAEDLVVIGDYAFAHAGIRPEVPIGAQRPEDLRWIREPFLDYRGTLDKVIVHGHTIRTEVEFRPHRIGIDTGGYASGRLTALGLEGTDRWTLAT